MYSFLFWDGIIQMQYFEIWKLKDYLDQDGRMCIHEQLTEQWNAHVNILQYVMYYRKQFSDIV